MDGQKIKLSKMGFALAWGIVWGLSMLVIGLIANMTGWAAAFIHVVGSLYVGYEPTVMGSVIGGLYGFIDAFIGGFIFAWLYNLCAHCCCKKCD